MPQSARTILPFFAALVAIGVAAALRSLLTPILPLGTVPFITFFPAVAVAAWYGGLWPGILAICAGYLVADWMFVEPEGLALLNGNGNALVELSMFVFMAAIIVAMAHRVHRAQLKTVAANKVAAHRGEMLRITLASIGDGVIATDAHGCVTFMNGVASSQTGWTEEEARGKPITEVFHIVNERTRAKVENPCEKVLRTGKIVGLANHTVLISRNGTERPIEDSAAPIIDGEGKIHGMVLVFVDATMQRKSQTAMQQLAAIVEHSDDAVISKNMNGIITSWNAAAERLYGFTAAEVVGQSIRLIVPDGHQDELVTIMERLRRGELIDHWDTVRLRKDRTAVDVSLRISPIRDEHGEVIGASKVARDITARKQVENSLKFLAETSASLAALIDRESALQQAAESMVPFFADWCVIYTLQPDGTIGNPACSHRDPAKRQLLGEFLAEYPVDWDSPSVTVSAWRTGSTQFIEEMSEDDLQRLGQNNGKILETMHALDPRSVLSVPLQIRHRTVGVVSFVRSRPNRNFKPADVPLAEDLGRRIATAIDNAQLLSSIRESEQQKDEFLAMLAHELRNPLAAIRYATEASRISPADAQGQMLDVIDRQTGNLTRLIDDLLDISRISREKIQLRHEHIEAGVVVERALSAVQPLIDEKHHRVKIEISASPLPLYVDATRAEQIVANLLTNAAKYSPDGCEILVKAFAEGSEAVVQVIDHGIGISPEMAPKVFDLFSQDARALDRSQGGLGIGLTIVRKLTEMHGGTVSVRSPGVGKGSTFTVRLPLSKLSRQQPDAPATTTEAQAPLRILVVDDNRDTAHAEAMLLKMHGHDVTLAHDGRSALELITSVRPDAVLLDIGLPIINGYDVAAKVRELGFTKELLIAVSGYGQQDDRERSRRAGFDHHLVKPVDMLELLSLLKTVRA